MKRIQSAGTFLCGLLVGGVLFGGGVAYAASVVAERSTQPIFVDGKQVQMEAYAIGGNNYVKLRDIGKEVDFNVSWDGATASVQIDSTSPYVEEAKPTTPGGKNADGSITIPEGDAKLTLKEGDVVRCDDGTNYTITDMSRYDKNAFAAGPLPALPTATCDWSSFPVVELPEVEVRHSTRDTGDMLFIRNLYETRRMQYTLWNLAGNNSETSENGKLKYNKQGDPYVKTLLNIPDEMNYQMFWPWRDSEIANVFNGCPRGTYWLEVWDVYKDGVFIRTEYQIEAK